MHACLKCNSSLNNTWNFYHKRYCTMKIIPQEHCQKNNLMICRAFMYVMVCWFTWSPYEIKLMLQYMINFENYFIFETLNSRLEPTAISWEFSEAKWFIILIREHGPEDDDCIYSWWILFAPTTSEDYASSLINDHHHDFCRLYPESNVIPKCILCKIDDQLCDQLNYDLATLICFYRFGPLVCHWTMRFEDKHSYFKQLVNSLENCINIAYIFATIWT